MGRIEVIRRWVEEKHLILTDEDWKLHDERRKRNLSYDAKPLRYMVTFARHLEPCPCCGNAPRINALWNAKKGFYSIKFGCCNENMLECGDWYEQLSRAGLDWNYRVRHQRGEPMKTALHLIYNRR